MPATAVQPCIETVANVIAPVRAAASTEITVSCEPVDREWDAFLAATPGGHHVQSSLWAQLKARLGWRVVRLVARENARVVGGAQILIRNYGTRIRIGYAPKGPVFATANVSTVTEFLDTLHEEVRAQNLQCLIVQSAKESVLMAALRERGFGPVRLASFVQSTSVIDLTRSLDEILMEMKPKTRKSVRQGQDRGVQVRRGGTDDIETLADLIRATAQRKGFHEYDKAYYQHLWKLFGPAGYAQIFVAEVDGEPVSASLRIAFGDTVVCKRRGWSGAFGNLRPNETLEWASIRWAKTAGYFNYDLDGASPTAAPSDSRDNSNRGNCEQSFITYKLGYGGKIQVLPKPLAYLKNPIARWGHRVLYPKVPNWPVIDRVIQRMRAK